MAIAFGASHPVTVSLTYPFGASDFRHQDLRSTVVNVAGHVVAANIRSGLFERRRELIQSRANYTSSGGLNHRTVRSRLAPAGSSRAGRSEVRIVDQHRR